MSCTAAIVRPKEGDGPDRAKYFQGIEFYEPEVMVKDIFDSSFADTPQEAAVSVGWFSQWLIGLSLCIEANEL